MASSYWPWSYLEQAQTQTFFNYSIRQQPGNRSQLRFELELHYDSLPRDEVLGDQLWRYLNQNNDLAELGQLFGGVQVQDVAVFKERL